MATKTTPKAASEKPAGETNLVFAKNCTNGHGSFVKGDRARGAFSRALVDSYLKVGILVRQASAKPAEPADQPADG